ncbi:hypothetical protein [Rufibacter immobilis]|uniref:hypothetical protein n=1 Tax=Rufibacter immobilis TaxID=1348778 RepID=UPI0035EEFB0B
MKNSLELIEDLISMTDMEEYKDLASELVVSFLATQDDLPEDKRDQMQNFHWSMSRFFNDAKKLQQASKKGIIV